LEVNITSLLECIFPHSEEQEVLLDNNEDAAVTEIEKDRAGEGAAKVKRSGQAVNLPERYCNDTALTATYERMMSDAEKVYYGYMAKCPDEDHKAALELSFLCSNHVFPMERKLEMTKYHIQDECHLF
jgi:hypothetical protein